MLFFTQLSLAQDWYSIRTKTVKVDSVLIPDSLPLLPGSITLFCNRKELPPASWMQSPNGMAIQFKSLPNCDSISVQYRVIFFKSEQLFYAKRAEKYRNLQTKGGFFQDEVYEPESQPLIPLGNLDKGGSISRGITLGNSQNATLQSGLNLQLAGEIKPGVSILASITDNNIPFQPDGYTQKIQDFDRVFIQLGFQHTKVLMGGFDLQNSDSKFIRYFKNVNGVQVEQSSDSVVPGYKFKQKGALAAARGKFGRNQFMGQDGVLGPYKLRGTDGEAFIVVLAGSEKVFVDGQLLKRGEQYDYVMDYNLAEIRFTPNRLITNQSRIIIEFEYANQAFVRLTTVYEAGLSKKDFEVKFMHYGERDQQSQPLQQKLTDDQKTLLSQVGNNLNLAVIPTGTAVSFNTSEVLYRMVDTLGFRNVFVNSTDSSLQLYRVQFSYVGEFQGDYKQSVSVVNGRVFEWLEPSVSGSDTSHQGNYAPVIQLIAPVNRTINALNLSWNIAQKWKVKAEAAASNFDLNTYSRIDNNLGRGSAASAEIERTDSIKLGKRTVGVSNKLKSELLSTGFRIVQPYRNAEFARDWNLKSIYSNQAELLNSYQITAAVDPFRKLDYKFQSLQLDANAYSATRHTAEWTGDRKSFKWMAKSDLMFGKNNQINGKFFRNTASITKSIGKSSLKAGYSQELNAWKTDTLLDKTAFRFDILEGGWEHSLKKGRLFAGYNRRTDFLPLFNELRQTQIGETYNLGAQLAGAHRLKLNINYRTLNVSSSAAKNDQTLAGQIDYSGSFVKNLISVSFYQNTGSGRELKRDFTYLLVQAGLGTHQWNDYNKDGVKQLNEFEPAIFPDSATYIKVLIPSNDYVQVYQNQFSGTFSITPENMRVKQSPSFERLYKLAKKWSALSSLSADRKLSGGNLLERLLPLGNVDTSIQVMAGNVLWRNSLFFNRNSIKSGFDLSHTLQNNRLLGTNGYEIRSLEEISLRGRYLVKSDFSLEMILKTGVKGSNAELFANRSYSIQQREGELKGSFQINDKTRISASGKYAVKSGMQLNFKDSVSYQSTSVEAEVNRFLGNSGQLRGTTTLSLIQYSGDSRTPMGFDALQGLQPGLNVQWSATWAKRLKNNLQLNLTYNGRKLGGSQVVHLGQVQVRYVF